MVPKLIIISGNANTGKTTLVQRIIDVLNLQNVRYSPSILGIESFRYSAYNYTIVFDEFPNLSDVYYDNYRNHRNCTFIIVIRNIRDIFVGRNTATLFHCTKDGEFAVNGIVNADDSHIGEFDLNGIVNADGSHIISSSTRSYRDHQQAILRVERFRRLKRSTRTELQTELQELQNIIFDNKENISTGDFLKSMNLMKSMYEK